MLSDLFKYIETTHLLNIQWDGFVVRPSAWDPEFLKYDYIGAPWKVHPHHHWPPFPDVTENNRVGNGGFSLRSKKLMEFMSIRFNNLLKGKKYHDPKYYHPEDCLICRTFR
jgi:hypothetical protein